MTALVTLLVTLLGLSVDPSSACIPGLFPFISPPTSPSSTSSSSSSSSSTFDNKADRRLDNATDCGHKGRSRVVGGSEAGQHEFPWHCALLNSEGKFYGCSATLISCDPVIAVTAAHCVPAINLPLITIKLRTPAYLACGRNNIDDNNPNQLEENEQRLRVDKVIAYPSFNKDTFENDIAVIKVQGSFNCVKTVLYPACLPDKQRLTYIGWEATTVTGWGRTGEGDPAAESLRKAKIPVVSDAECKRVMKKQSEAPAIRDNMMCGGSLQGGVDSCQGDSGGPLVTTASRAGRRLRRSSEGWSLVGVVSWGLGCARPNTYGVYTELAPYLPWVARQYGLSY